MKLRKRFFGILIMMCILIGMLPTIALAEERAYLGYTGFYAQTEDGTVVDGTKVTVVLWNTEEDEIVVAESTDGKVDIDANEMYHNETETALVYHGKEYAYLRVEFDLPDGYAYYTGENEFVEFFEAKDLDISVGYMYTVGEMSDEESTYYETVFFNQYCTVNKFYECGKVISATVNFDFVNRDIDEEIILEALSYVTKEDQPTVLMRVKKEEKLLEISARVMCTLSQLDTALTIVQDDTHGLAIVPVPTEEAFCFELKKNNNQSIIDKLNVAGIENGYIQYEILGSGQQENLYVFDTFELGGLSYPETDETSDNDYVEKYIYYYDMEKEVLVLMQDTAASYLEEEDNAILVFEINQRGTYVISDKVLPESLTTQKEDTPADIPTDIVTDEVVEEDVLEKVKEQDGSLNIKVEESDKSSFVNWTFNKIEHVIDFLPTVHVDVQIDEVSKCVEAAKVTADFKYTTVSFDFDGVLPGKAEVTLDIQNSNLGKADVVEGQVVYLYYFNPDTKDFEYIDESAMKDGFATFTMTHCSDYIITTEKLAEDVGVDVPKTGDNTMVGLYTVVLLLGFACLYLSRKYKNVA